MKYLLDTNILHTSLINKNLKQGEFFVIQDVVDEWVNSSEKISRIRRAGIGILEIGKKHLDKLTEVLTAHGDNFDLIRLYTGEGTADVMMLAYILAEKEKPETLFEEEFTLVTNDKPLIKAAEGYGIKCMSSSGISKL